MERDPCCVIGDYLLLDWVKESEGSAMSRAVNMYTHKVVAVKLLDKYCFKKYDTSVKKLDHNNGCFSTNISILKKLNHDNVVKVLDGFLLNQSIPVSTGYHPFQLRFVVVMEYCYGRNLRGWLSEVEDLGHSSQLHIFSQLVDGVNYLHKQNLVHGRIQPSNVWVQGGRPMLCGFGLGNYYDGSWNECDRRCYSAPEWLDDLQGFPHPPGEKSDVFSLGMLLVQLHFGQDAFHQWIRSKIRIFNECREPSFQLGSPFIQLPIQHCLTNAMKRLVYDMISPDYDLRIGVELVKDMLNNEMDLL